MALSQEQLTKLKARLVTSPQPVTTDEVSSVNKGFAQSIKDAFSSRVGKAQEAQSKVIEGKQSALGGTLQTIGQGAGFVGDIAGETLLSAGKIVTPKPVEKAISSGVQSIFGSKPIQEVAMQYEQLKQQYPEAIANLESIVNIGSLIPVGAVGKVAGNTALKSAGTVLETTADVLETTGKASKTGAGKIYQSAITPNVKEAEKILQAEIKGTVAPQTRASTALEQGIAGTQKGIAVKGGKIADKLYTEKIIPALESTKGKVTMSKSELFARVEDRINKTVDPTKKKSLIDAYEAIRQDYADFPDNFDLVTAQNLKKNLDEFTPEKIFRGQNVANELKVLNNDMANAIRSKTYGALEDVNIKKDYLDYGNLKELEKIGVKAITESGRFGGTGTLLSYLSDKALTPVKTIGGQVLYRIGDAFEVTGKKGLKTFADYLKSKNVNINTDKAVKGLIDNAKNNPNRQGGFIKNPLSQSDNLIQEAKKYKTADEFVKAQTGGKFGNIKKIDINNPQEQAYISDFADNFMTQKSPASGLTYSTLDKMGSLNTALKQKGFKGVSNSADFKGIYSLDKVIDNPSLFEKYPDLKKTNVIFADFHTPTQRGVHIGNDIFLNSKLYAKDSTNIESTLVHEVEHAIQDIKGNLPKYSSFEQGRGMNAVEYSKDARENEARARQQEYLDIVKTKSQLEEIWKQANKK